MGHGTATRKKTIGNAKWRSQGKPPIKKRHLKVNAITTSVNAQLIKRQSGFASATNRSGKNRNAQRTAAAAGKSRPGSEDQLQEPPLAAYYGFMLAVAGEKSKACKYVEIGKTGHLLPEEKQLIDRAEAAVRQL